MKAALESLLRELVVQELNTTSSGGSNMTSGTGEQFAAPKAFKKTENSKPLTVSKKLGYSRVSRPKRPSHTKLFDFLQ